MPPLIPRSKEVNPMRRGRRKRRREKRRRKDRERFALRMAEQDDVGSLMVVPWPHRPRKARQNTRRAS